MSDVVAAPSAAPSTTASTPSPAASSTPAPASSAPTATPDAPVTSTEPGPIPYARFKEVNDQLRTAKEAATKYEQLKWAEQFQTQPYEFVDSWMDQLAQSPQYQQQIYAKAARMLQSRRGQHAPEPPQPDIPVMDANGNVVSHTYSAKQLDARDQWIWQQREQALLQRMQPLEQFRTSVQQQQQQAALQHEATQQATSTLTKMRQTPWFTEHEQAIKQHFAEHEEYGDNLQAAALDYFNAHVLPTYGQKAEAKVLDTLHTQAAGATVHPSASTPTARPKFKDFGDAIRYYDAHPDEAAAMAKR